MTDYALPTPLPAVEQLTSELTQLVSSDWSRGRLFQISGPPTAGKTAVLRSLRDTLSEAGLAPIMVSPPAGALDAAAVGLMQIGVGLREHGYINGQLESLEDPERPWLEKLDLVKEWTANADERLVFLCDEPEVWAPQDRETLGHFSEHADDVRLLILLNGNCRRVVSGLLPNLARPDRVMRLDKRSDPKAFLLNDHRWREEELREAAAQLAEGFPELDRQSNLELRLLVAHVVLTSIDSVRAAFPPTARRSMISRLLAQRLATNKKWSPLWRMWQQLSWVRGPIDEELLQTLGAERLTPLLAKVLRECILYPISEGTYALHGVLQRDAHQIPSTMRIAPRVHRVLAQHYTARFAADQSAGDHPRALLDEMEAFHHAVESGDAALLEQSRAFFVDQLDAWGRYLSRDAHEFQAAVEVFDRSTRWDADDDYAHHYLAFNLDIQGSDPTRVEQHYRRAIEIEPYWSLWWARYIDFLVIRGRAEDAREAWSEALEVLSLPYSESGSLFFERLHGWVARTLLHRGNLGFARLVLEDVPPSVESEKIDALWRRLNALEEADERGAFLPGRLLEEPKWWERGPFLLETRDPHSEERLVRWLAARVQEIKDNCFVLIAAEVNPGSSEEPRTTRTTLTAEQFENAVADDIGVRDIEVGTFLELGLYVEPKGRDKPRMKIRVHRDDAWIDDSLPRLFPDPARYLKQHLRSRGIRATRARR